MVTYGNPLAQKIWEYFGEQPVKIHEIAKKFNVSYNTALRQLLILVAEHKAEMIYDFGMRVFVKKRQLPEIQPKNMEMISNEQ